MYKRQIANGGHIVTQQFYDQFINITGAGITIGLIMYMFFFAKDVYKRQHLKYIHYEAPVEEQNFSTLIEFINAMEVREDDEERCV